MSTRLSTPDILGNALTGKAEPERISLASIKTNGGTQMRAGLNESIVADYREAMQDNGWGEFPPVVTFYDGSIHWLADGFHRLAAYRLIAASRGESTVPAVVKAGGQRDAILHAASANANHGLRRTNADKRRAVEVLLRDAEWQQWSDQEIARRCAVDPKTVGNIRREMLTTLEIPESTTRTGADGRVINTANIGANRPSRLYINDLKTIVADWMAEHWAPREWPENPSHTNGTFWQELTAWLHANRTETWYESDLKTAIKDRHFNARLSDLQGFRQVPASTTQTAPATPAEPASDYAPVWQLEVGVRKAVATEWAAATDERIRLLVLAKMNQARLAKAGALWNDIKDAMPDTVKAYRHQDLQQAIDNVAEQLKQGMQREAGAQNGNTQRPTTQKQEFAVHPLAVKRLISKWLNDQTGGDPRKIVELAERIHAMDMRHPQWWQMYPAGADAQDVIDALEDCIDEAAARVAEFAGGPKPLEEDVNPEPAGYSHPSMAGLPVLSLPTEYYDEPDPEPEHPLDTYDNEKATPDARRMERLWDTKQELKRIIEEILPRWDNLTGRATESLAAYRELRKLIDILEDEMDALDPNVTKKEVTLA